ncbi:MAG TPA: glycosyltransferase family 9 protein [Vicinamibacterales bacterium]
MERFLIVRLGALGDVVHAIPVAAAIRRAYPSARIDWLVSAKHREILDLVSVVDRRLVINDRPSADADAAASGNAKPADVQGTSLWQVVRALRQNRYDVAIDLQGLLKSAVLARASGARRVIGFSRRYARESFASLFYSQSYDAGRGGLYDPRETRHVVAINLGLLTLLGIQTDRPAFPIDAVESTAARRACEATGGRYALLNPGAAWPNKRWPPERFAALAAALRDRQHLMSVVLWGPGEESLARETVAAAGGAAIATDRTAIADVVALARGAAVMVSGDTGPTHIAAAVGTPLVGLYGPTRAVRNGPLLPQDVAVTRDAICQCHHLRRCKLDRMCLLDIEVAEVLSAVERRLAAGPALD